MNAMINLKIEGVGVVMNEMMVPIKVQEAATKEEEDEEEGETETKGVILTNINNEAVTKEEGMIMEEILMEIRVAINNVIIRAREEISEAVISKEITQMATKTIDISFEK
jgi:hypothetical protein